MTKAERIVLAHEFDKGADHLYAMDAAAHPETVSTPEDYPGWDPSMGCVPAPKPEAN